MGEEVLQLLTDYPLYAVNIYGAGRTNAAVDLLREVPLCTRFRASDMSPLDPVLILSINSAMPDDVRGASLVILTGVTGSVQDLLLFRILSGLNPATRFVLVSEEPVNWASVVCVPGERPTARMVPMGNLS